MKSVLMIAYHYPPVGVSSGVHRTLKFSQYLSKYDWNPIVLTINPKAYERTSDHQLKDIPKSVVVKRAFGLDSAKHLSIAGRYPSFFALPDRWVTWCIGGIWSGLKLIKNYKPKIIFSTYPIATAHIIGFALHKLTGIPWVCDFRDSMTEVDYPKGKIKWKLYRWIEEKAVKNASKVIFTTPGTVEMYQARYPHIPNSRWAVIENGYDEESFIEIEKMVVTKSGNKGERIVLVHSGLLYPYERDPRDFFHAVAELKGEGKISSEGLSIILRASGDEDYYNDMLNELDIADIIELAPSVNYGQALKEMLLVDGLLIFQGSSCNHQIPAKVYEYIRAKKPILGLTDLTGDTANVLRQAGIDTLVELDAKDNIKDSLVLFVQKIRENNAPLPNEEFIKTCDRKSKAVQLASILDIV